MTGSFTPQGKTSPSAKPRRCEVGAWQTEAVREEPPCRSVFPLRQCGKAGQPRACSSPPPSVRPQAGPRESSVGLGSTWRSRKLRDHCSSEGWLTMSTVQGVRRPQLLTTLPPQASECPEAVKRSSRQASVSLAIRLRVSVAWDALSGR